MRPFKVLKISVVLVALLGVLNIPTVTIQGVNSITYERRIPLYIKMFEFMDRDYHYKRLVRDITAGCGSDYEKTILLFEWTYKNIRTDLPPDWPIVDDHIWYTIVRGYGTEGQLSDVFTTLCVYAGLEARILDIWHESGKKLILSAVKLEDQWVILDPYYRIYFTMPSGRLATVNDILKDPSLIIRKHTESILHQGVRYIEYFRDLPSIDFDRLRRPRAYRQNLFKRIYYETKAKLGN